jgi:hypothetical protein
LYANVALCPFCPDLTPYELLNAPSETISTTHVPVGEDQTQHLELTRDLASAVNERFRADIFTIPSGYSGKTSAGNTSLKGSASQDVVLFLYASITSFPRFQRSGVAHNEPTKANGEDEQVRPIRLVSDKSRWWDGGNLLW